MVISSRFVALNLFKKCSLQRQEVYWALCQRDNLCSTTVVFSWIKLSDDSMWTSMYTEQLKPLHVTSYLQI